MKSMVYLAQPIDQARRTPRAGRLVEAAKQAAAAARVSTYQPARAFHLYGRGRKLGAVELEQIDAINRQALTVCAGLIAVIPLGVPTLGTPVEVERALLAGKPVLIVADDDLIDSSVQLQSWERAGAMVVSPSWVERASPDNEQTLFEFFNAQRLPAPPAAPPSMPYVREDILSTVPGRAYPDDAGLDLAACETATVEPGGKALVRTGLKFAVPEGYWGLILGRSSTWAKRELVVMPGVIDAGWRGELYISLWNPGAEAAKVEIGDRLAQYIILPAWLGQLREVEALPPHARGTNGFGSSGR